MTRPRLTLMIGGPASGKSFMLKKLRPGLPVVDSDRIKATHPDYSPNDASWLTSVHAWSSRKATEEFYRRLSRRESFAFDGTGCNAEKYVSFISAARAAGYDTEAIYVTCDLATALKRNAERERHVDEDMLREKYAVIATSFEIVARYVDRVEVVNGITERSKS